MHGHAHPEPARPARRPAALIAVGLVGLGAVAARLDAPADGSVLGLGGATWAGDGVVVRVPGSPGETGLHTGDLVTAIDGHQLASGIGGVPEPAVGAVLEYVLAPGSARLVVADRPDPWALIAGGWGDLVFVLALGLLAWALFVRRPDEPATTPLLIAAAGLFGSTLTVVAGLPALALATGSPLLWLFHLNVIGAYSLAWGAVLAASLVFSPRHPWLARGRPGVLALAYAAPVVVMAGWAAALAVVVPNPIRRFGLLGTGQTAVSAATLVIAVVAGGLAYRRSVDPVGRERLRWITGGGALSVVVGLAGWSLPELLTGRPLVPPGALGLSGLPFVVGLAVALRRHRLFDIDRLANRAVTYAAVLGVLAATYAATVAVLVAGLRVSGGVAAALAAAVAALALAPLRTAAQGVVNRLMYGQRDDPAGVLAGLGGRLQAALLPDDVPMTVVDTVTRSLRVPFAAIDLADGAGGYRTVAVHGVPVGRVHTEELTHLGDPVGRLRVSGRGRDDPLDPVDLSLIRSLAQQAGAAVLAARLHDDLVRSRAALVTLREEERRGLRRELHDGLGPSLAAIALKAGLATRELPAGTGRRLIADISAEVQTTIADVRRVVDGLRPPALDELGLIGALAARAGSLSGGMDLEVSGPAGRLALPAAVETAAYRIAVEAMTNAVRHSGGRHCAVTVEAGARDLEVTIVDDGRGLSPDRPPGVGLRSMRERADELGGDCQLGAPPAGGGGTLVRARLPLPAGASA